MMQQTYIDDSEQIIDDDSVYTECDKRPLLSSASAKNVKTRVKIFLNDEPLDDDSHDNGATNRLLSAAIYQQNAYRNNRRYHHGSERWGRIRLGIASIVFICVIYFCFVFGTWVDQRQSQMVVNIPPLDDSLPGPKDYDELGPIQEYVNNFFSRQPLYSEHETITLTSTSSSLTSSTPTPITSPPTSPPPPSSSSSVWTSKTPNFINHTVPNGYLVSSPGCKMPALDPLAKDVMRLFHREKYESCSTSEPLTSIQMNWTASTATLTLNQNVVWYKSAKNVSCCYQEIRRTGTGKHADEQFKLSGCFHFNGSMVLPATLEYILVKCKSNSKQSYANSHAIMRERSNLQKRLKEFREQSSTQPNQVDNNSEEAVGDEKPRPLSVLMLSIDSISRLNLIRAMPKTAQHLYKNKWFELQGYNKIDDNTYPNLMAILTGYNNSLAYGMCNPRSPGKLDKCPFVWSDYRDAGYVTAYGEDEASISTFNYHKVGFQNPPTDYYMRPYMLAAEKNLKIKRKHSLAFCLGFKHSADHIYDYAVDFATQYRKEPSFGLFWTNTFSHNDISDPTSMDQKMENYLTDLDRRGILNESMVVFFSDHGLRFGPVRHLITGWLEERLPFMFIWLPQWFRVEHPEIVQALKINRNRLTNPYDLHMTLKHILELSGRMTDMPPATSCANCQSLFREMPWNRSCEETSIAGHWCTCAPYKPTNEKSKMVKDAVSFVLKQLNAELKKHGNLCAELTLHTIAYARKAEYIREANGSYNDYMCVFQAMPSRGWFETTVRYTLNTKQFEVTGSVSRLDMYASQSACMKIDNLRKYCYCNSSNKKKG